MAYTHNFEIKISGITIEGEIYFGDGQPASFKTNAGEEMTLDQHAKVQELLHMITEFSTKCGLIEKIEFTKKI